ncbi:biotin-dependent carboxyltransferase family protein [Aquincola sp. MAHUQ-54]|uniref:Biotin-dependent carboxyltransferase family protein n=1 Tax=Aquincola agrisoli TaxID=3119538 RepID=A0AAW9QIT2_9BURK
MTIEVLKPGAQSQLQDMGRWGHQRFGVPVGGAMDAWSHRVANLLAGNEADEATLEIVLMGPSLRFTAPACIAICGADMSPRIGDEPVPMHRRVWVAAGTQLDFGRRMSGLRSYLAVRGGFGVAPVMGSRSTFVRGGFGGFEGRALRKGDVLPLGQGAGGAARPGDGLGAAGRPWSAAPLDPGVPEPAGVLPPAAADAVVTLRVVRGEHWGAFPPEMQAQFSQAVYRLSPQSDRMGYRLQGPALLRSSAAELISEGVAFGTVQVPPDGQPIVLMAERQSAGGYPKIAHIASVDLPLLAQVAPQQGLRFQAIALETAQALYLDREHRLAHLRDALAAPKEKTA